MLSFASILFLFPLICLAFSAQIPCLHDSIPFNDLCRCNYGYSGIQCAQCSNSNACVSFLKNNSEISCLGPHLDPQHSNQPILEGMIVDPLLQERSSSNYWQMKCSELQQGNNANCTIWWLWNRFEIFSCQMQQCHLRLIQNTMNLEIYCHSTVQCQCTERCNQDLQKMIPQLRGYSSLLFFDWKTNHETVLFYPSDCHRMRCVIMRVVLKKSNGGQELLIQHQQQFAHLQQQEEYQIKTEATKTVRTTAARISIVASTKRHKEQQEKLEKQEEELEEQKEN